MKGLLPEGQKGHVVCFVVAGRVAVECIQVRQAEFGGNGPGQEAGGVRTGRLAPAGGVVTIQSAGTRGDQTLIKAASAAVLFAVLSSPMSRFHSWYSWKQDRRPGPGSTRRRKRPFQRGGRGSRNGLGLVALRRLK